jgi:hypothetical protein
VTRKPTVLLALTLLGTFATAFAQDSAPPGKLLEPFRATYSVSYRGLNAGNLVFTLRRLRDDDLWEYFSKPEPSFLARLVVSGDALETSEFELRDARVRPLRYRVEDGRSSSDDDVRLDFDWDRGTVEGLAKEQQVALELTPGMQDRMSIQVEVIAALAAGREPGTISMIDGDRVKNYTYTREGTERISTAEGSFDTVIYASTRPGSDRVARFWYARELGYVPVLGHQIRKGKLETIMKLEQYAPLD